MDKSEGDAARGSNRQNHCYVRDYFLDVKKDFFVNLISSIIG